MPKALRRLLGAKAHFSEHWVRHLLQSDVMWDRLGVYPPFLFFGIQFAWSDAGHSLKVTMPLRWYFRNNSGVMFGAAMAVASDPFPALMLQRLVPGTVAWTRSHQIQYLRPATGPVSFSVSVTEAELAEFQQGLERHGRAHRKYEFAFYDQAGRRVANVTTSAYLAKKPAT